MSSSRASPSPIASGRPAPGLRPPADDAAGLVDAMLGADEAGVLALVKARAGRLVGQLAGALEPILAGASPALHQDTYDVFRQLCVAHARALTG